MPSSSFSFSHPQYVPIEVVGRGGMGTVYRCKDLKMEKDVAVKVIGWNLTNEQIVRFQREARALAKLSHPNIVGIENFAHADDGSLLLVMELLEGQQLSSMITEAQSVPFEEALEIFIQICAGLNHAHNKGILHRDIKPSNIFLLRTSNSTTHVKITDFGLAKLLTEDQRLTKTGIGIGSPPYMSPEQAGGADVDERSDIYSLGCLMFEILSGEPPFTGTSVQHLLLRHVQEAPPSLISRATDRSFPEQIDAIVTRCLAKSPEKRFQTASDLSDALQQLRNLSLLRYADGSEFSGNYSQQVLTGTTQTGRARSLQQPKLILHVVLSLLVLGTLAAAGAGWLVYIDSGKADKTKDEPYLTKTDNNEIEQLAGSDEPEQKTSNKIPTVVINWRMARNKLEGLLEKYRNHSADEYPNLSLAKSDIQDEDLQLLEGVPIKRLNLFHTSITDKGLTYLSKMPCLEELDIGHTHVTDEGLKLLQNFPRLGTIRLTKTAITDNGITELAKCSTLKWIGLVNCKRVTGTTLGALRNLKKLYLLNLARSGLKGENIKELRGVEVYYIDLSGIQLNDAEINTLAEVTKGRLQMLLVNHNRKITGKSFIELGRNTNLMMISIIGCPGIELRDQAAFIQAHRLPVKIIDRPLENQEKLKRARLRRERTVPVEELDEEE